MRELGTFKAESAEVFTRGILGFSEPLWNPEKKEDSSETSSDTFLMDFLDVIFNRQRRLGRDSRIVTRNEQARKR